MAGRLRDRELERELLADPSEDGSKLVYADWLQARGDAWGELIVMQHGRAPNPEPLFRWDDPSAIRHAVSSHPTDSELFHASRGLLEPRRLPPEAGLRERELCEQVLDEALGPCGDASVRVRWRSGFIDGLFVPQGGCDGDDLFDMLCSLLEHRAGLLLRQLAIGAIRWNSANKYEGYSLHYDDILELLAIAAPQTLEHLALGAWSEHDISWTAIGDLRELHGALPSLRVLELQGNAYSFGEMDLPRLERLLVRSGGLPERALLELAEARLPALRELTLWFGSNDFGGCEDVAVAAPFLRAHERHPRLRRLGLANAMFTDELCALLPRAPVLPQLTHLDLSMGMMSDEGARALLASRSAFAHLEHLDLRDNSLSSDACAQLASLCPSVDTRYQREWRYVTVSE